MSQKIALSTGGTGGHVFPAVCLAEELTNYQYNIVWCTDQRGAQYIPAPLADSSKQCLFYLAKAQGKLGILKQYLTLIPATFKTIKFFLSQKPDLVVGFGGYTTAPVVLAALFLRIPIVLHEQNAVLGRVNRWMARFAKWIALGFSHTQKVPSSLPTVYVGNPVRSEIAEIGTHPYEIPSEKITILVLGGSQGAAIFSTILPQAIALLPASEQQRLLIVQQARAEWVKTTQDAYQKLGIEATVQPFFNDMPYRYSQAHCIIARSGAMTVAEVCATHRPALFVPLASAMDNHQYFNACELAGQNLAWVMPQEEFTPQNLAHHLRGVLADPSLLCHMAERLKKKYSSDATQKLAQAVVDLLRTKK